MNDKNGQKLGRYMNHKDFVVLICLFLTQTGRNRKAIDELQKVLVERALHMWSAICYHTFVYCE